MTGLIGTANASDAMCRRQVAAAARTISRYGHEDLTLGHVSVRSATGDSMWIKRKGVALSEVTVDDVIAADLGDEPPRGDLMHYEAIMHHEAYRRRGDINAVIHTHPWYATAFGASDAEFQMLSHDGVLFKDGIGRYSDSSGLITTGPDAERVVNALGSKRVTMLRHHGVLIVGEDIRWAVLAAITLERSIRLQWMASGLGEINPIAPGDVEDLYLEKYRERFLAEYWDAWLRDLEATGFTS
ncbi:MAG: class II aldolase/adducin family protein [Armatimonadetes bacterium]|nr:MAG: class II aldolase/adducin family protein [Armatimonadota bacterium]